MAANAELWAFSFTSSQYHYGNQNMKNQKEREAKKVKTMKEDTGVETTDELAG